jgi:hypothetical protein
MGPPEAKGPNKGTMCHDRSTKQQHSIGFAWSNPRKRKEPSKHFKHDQNWLENYNKLVNVSNEHGHCLVPRSYDKGTALGHWVGTQRSRQAQKILRQDRKELLDKIGFVWKVARKTRKNDVAAATRPTQLDIQWGTQCSSILCQFKQMNGHPHVPPNFKTGGPVP